MAPSSSAAPVPGKSGSVWAPTPMSDASAKTEIGRGKKSDAACRRREIPTDLHRSIALPQARHQPGEWPDRWLHHPNIPYRHHLIIDPYGAAYVPTTAP